jgi:hypothetical protein
MIPALQPPLWKEYSSREVDIKAEPEVGVWTTKMNFWFSYLSPDHGKLCASIYGWFLEH